MSKLVDERVVEMKFDNSNFEKNTKQTISTLERLKSALNFSGSSKSMTNEFDSATSSSFGLEAGLSKVGDGFNALEVIAIGALTKIGAQITQIGENLVKSLSVDNIASGWEAYESKSTTVGTLVTQGYSMDEINEQLKLLSQYSDATSYDFTQMLSTIAKFTGAGQKLDTSVTAIMGIANWAAQAGQNSTVASQAMYQLSQAMAKGVVKTNDWQSIQNYNMATTQFKQNVLEAAAALGQLSYDDNGGVYKLITSAGETIVAEINEATGELDIKNFESTLSEGWFTSDVLMKALEKYAGNVEDVLGLIGTTSTITGEEINSVQGAIDEYNKQLENMKENLSDADYEAAKLSTDTLQAATECRTFTNVLNAAKDAIKTTWSDTFEIIFGDYEQAKKLWTDFYDKFIYSIFVKGNEDRNDLLSSWAETNRDDLFGDGGALWQLADAIVNFRDIVKSAWAEIVGTLTSSNLSSFTSGLKTGLATINTFLTNSDNVTKLSNVFKGLFSVVRLVKDAFKGLYEGIKPIWSVLGGGANSLLDVLSNLGLKFSNFVTNLNLAKTISSKVSEVLIKAINKITEKYKQLKQELTDSSGGVSTISEIVNGAKAGLEIIKKALGGLVVVIQKYVLPALSIIVNWAIKVAGVLTGYLTDAIKQISKWIVQFNSNLDDSIARNSVMQDFVEWFKSIPTKLVNIVPFLGKVFDVIKRLAGLIVELANSFNDFITQVTGRSILGNIKYILSILWDFIRNIPEGLKKFAPYAKSIKDFFVSLWNTIKSVFKGLNNGIKELTGLSIGEWFIKLGQTIKNVVVKIGEFFSAIGTKGKEGLTSFANTAKTQLQPIMSLFEGLKNFFAGLLDFIKALLPFIGKLLTLIGQVFTSLAQKLTDFSNSDSPFGINWGDLLKVGIGVILTKVLLNVFTFLEQFNVMAKKMLKSIGNLIYIKEMETYASALKNFAIAILLVVGSLIVLSTLDTKKLWSAVGVLAVIFTAMIAVMKIMAKFALQGSQTFKLFNKTKTGFKLFDYSSKGSSVTSMATSLLMFSAAVLVLSFALGKLAKMDTKQMWTGLAAIAAITGIMVAMVGLFRLFSKIKLSPQQEKAYSKSMKMVNSMAWTLILFCVPIAILGNMQSSKLWQGIAAIAAISAIILAFNALLRAIAKSDKKGSPNAKATLASMASIISLVLSFTKSIVKLGSLDTKILLKGSIAAAAITAGLLLLMNSLQKIEKVKSTSKNKKVKKDLVGIGLILSGIAVVMLAMADVIAILSKSRDWNVVGMFATVMITTIGLISGLVLALGKMKLSKANTKAIDYLSIIFLAISASMLIIASAFLIMEKVSWSKGILGIVSFGALVAATVALLYAVKKLKVDKDTIKNVSILGTMLFTLATAFAILAIGLNLLNDVEWNTMAVGAIALVAVLATLTAALVILSKFAPTLQTLAISFVIFNSGIAVFAASILILAGALSLVVDSLSKFIAVMTLLAVSSVDFTGAFDKISGSIQEFVKALTSGLMLGITTIMPTILESLVDVVPTIVEIFTSAVKEILNQLNSLIPAFGTTITNIIDEVLELLNSRGPNIVESLMALIANIFEQIGNNAEKIWSGLTNFILVGLDTITANMEQIVSKLINMLIAIIDTLTNRIGDIVDSIVRFAEAFVTSVVNAIIEFVPFMVDSAYTLIIGLIDGLGQAIEDNAGRITEAIGRFFQHIGNAIAKLFGFSSSGTGESSTFKSYGNQAMSGFSSAIKNFNIGSVFKNIFSNIKSWFSGVFTNIKTIGKNIIQGLVDGLKSMVDNVKNFFTNLGENICNWFKNVLGIASPSKVFKQFGKYIDQGLINGVEGETSSVYDSMSNLSDAVVDGFNSESVTSALSQVADTLNSELSDDNLTIRPVMDLSEIQNGANKIGNMMNDLNGYSISGNTDLANKTSRELSSSKIYSGSSNGTGNQTLSDDYAINNTFNITGSNAKEIADEVAQRIQLEIDRRKTKWA